MLLRLFALSLLLTALSPAQKVPESKVRQALGVREGDPLPASKGDAEDRLAELQGVVESHLEAACCEAGKVILYVGIEEKGAPHFELHEFPDGDVTLPDEIKAAYRDFLEASREAVREGQDRDDLTHGHRLSANPGTRAAQEKFIPIANDHVAELRDVLKHSSDEDQRAAAAYMIGYSDKKSEIVDDLEYALRDPDAGVRINATRSLVALAVLARLDPSSSVKIAPTWFVEMLNSLSWSDRTQALMALQILTDNRDPAVLSELRQRALASLVEMARWKTLAHALPAYILLGRIAGLPEKDIEDSWSRGDRNAVILAASKKAK